MNTSQSEYQEPQLSNNLNHLNGVSIFRSMEESVHRTPTHVSYTWKVMVLGQRNTERLVTTEEDKVTKISLSGRKIHCLSS